MSGTSCPPTGGCSCGNTPGGRVFSMAVLSSAVLPPQALLHHRNRKTQWQTRHRLQRGGAAAGRRRAGGDAPHDRLRHQPASSACATGHRRGRSPCAGWRARQGLPTRGWRRGGARCDAAAAGRTGKAAEAIGTAIWLSRAALSVVEQEPRPLCPALACRAVNNSPMRSRRQQPAAPTLTLPPHPPPPPPLANTHRRATLRSWRSSSARSSRRWRARRQAQLWLQPLRPQRQPPHQPRLPARSPLPATRPCPPQPRGRLHPPKQPRRFQRPRAAMQTCPQGWLWRPAAAPCLRHLPPPHRQH